MPLLLNSDQEAIADQARRILEARSSTEGALALLEQQGAHDETFWRTAREQGWTSLTLPETRGGLGLGLVELGLVAHQIGRYLAGAPFLTSNAGVLRALLASGCSDWVAPLADGEAIGAVAFCEHQAVLPAAPSVRFSDGRLHGVKTGVTAGIQAQVAVVLASGEAGLVLAVAPLDGVERRPIPSFDNSRGTADLLFAGAPATSLREGEAAREAALGVLAFQAVITAHEQTGGAEALMERARDYALTRRAFGQPIGAFQSVKHRIAELYALVELARANALQAAALCGSADFVRAAAAARLSATEAYDTAARDCVQIHGGIGVTWEAGLHLHMRRARTLAIEQGNSLFWEDVLVDQLGRDAA